MLVAFRGDCLISIPLFHQDRFIILWLGLYPYICFCSVHVIRLFGWCSWLLDLALDTSPLNWNIISFPVNFNYMYYELLSQRKIFYSWMLLFSRLWLIIFDFPLLFICISASFGCQWETIHKHIAIMNFITWQGKSECSDWFFLGQDFAIHIISMETVISCVFFVFES